MVGKSLARRILASSPKPAQEGHSAVCELMEHVCGPNSPTPVWGAQTDLDNHALPYSN